ncbi:S8 family serine peptidase [Deinococcus sonorensis]|uniref:S8 family serine peptidase n=2 Tax=Deinococcus sonorensis TaxID=309891 RepID=A0AAU7UEZ9_9DEIO
MNRVHTKKLGNLSLALTLLLAACGQSSVTTVRPVPTDSKFTLDPTRSFQTGQVVVGLPDGVSAAAAAATVGGQVLREMPALHAALIRLPDGLSVNKAVHAYAAAGSVRYAEPNYLMTTPERSSHTAQALSAASLAPQAVATTLNDPQLGKQWFLKNMGAYKAWETATGKGIRIGVADEDIDRNHPDLKANIVYPGYDSPNDKLITPTTAYDGVGEHGTWVAGTAAAVGNNGIGGAGVAYQASIVPITITHDATGASSVDSAYAFLWAVVGPDGKAPGETGDTDTPAGHNGYVDVLNYSFGGSDYSQLDKEAVDYVLSNGVVFVTSAGNTPTTGPASPAWTPGAISVAATTPYNERTGFSNRGSHITVAAPGQNMWLTTLRTNVSNPDEANYSYVDGTSFSSPATAGTIALILQASATKNPDGSVAKITLTPAQVRHLLEDTAFKPTGSYSIDTGNGVVRADAAVAAASKADVATTTEKGVNVTLKFVASSNTAVSIPLVGVTMVGGKRPDQLLYAQSAAGNAFFPTGIASFREIDAGDYQLYASGPRTVVVGGNAGVASATLSLAPGESLAKAVQLPITLPTDSNEPNNTRATATAIDYGQVQDGVLAETDTDLYKFTGTAGDKASINTLTNGLSRYIDSGPDLRLQVLDASGTVVATNDDQRSGVSDAALDYTIPTTGTYYIKVDDQNGGTPVNSYWVSLSKRAGSETEPNGSGTVKGAAFSNVDFSKANVLGMGQALDASIGTASDVDVYTFNGTTGQQIVADINASVSGKPDTVMALYRKGTGTAPTLITGNDDSTSTDSTIEAKLPSNDTYYLVVGAFTNSTQSSSGDYRISLDQR